MLVPATWLVISPDLQAGFLATAPFVIILSLARVLTQIMLPTPLHLKQRLTAIFALAAIDCALLNLFALASAFLLAPSAATLMAGGALGAIFASLIGLRLMATLPFDFTWSPVLLAAAGLGVTIVAFVLSYRVRHRRYCRRDCHWWGLLPLGAQSPAARHARVNRRVIVGRDSEPRPR